MTHRVDYLDRIGFVLDEVRHHGCDGARFLARANLGLYTVGHRLLLLSVDDDACHVELAAMHLTCDNGERTAI